MEKYTLTLKSVQDVADGTKMFVFDKPVGFSFKAGQYVALEVKEFTVEDDGKGRFRSLSIASAPYEDELHFVMRAGESSFKKTMWSLAVGDEVFVMKPVGSFVLSEEDDATPVVFLIGGVWRGGGARIYLQGDDHEVYRRPSRDEVLYRRIPGFLQCHEGRRPQPRGRRRCYPHGFFHRTPFSEERKHTGVSWCMRVSYNGSYVSLPS